jgi:hypothetical protein
MAVKYTYSRKKGQKNSARSDNGGGSGWSEEGKQYLDFLYRVVQTDQNQQAGIGGSKKGRNFFQQRTVELLFV